MRNNKVYMVIMGLLSNAQEFNRCGDIENANTYINKAKAVVLETIDPTQEITDEQFNDIMKMYNL